jgi:phosphoribosylformylglycinamidine (FGAM) synthase-like enzyme
VSGKDSMKNDFIGKTADGREVKISVLPTLLVTALSYHPDVRNVLKPHAQAGSVLYLLGGENARASLGEKSADGSSETLDHSETAKHYFGTTLPKYFEVTSLPALEFDLTKTRKFYGAFHKACKSHLIESAHDVSEGGILFAVFEKLMLNNAGITFDATINILSCLSEEPGRILVTVKSENQKEFERAFSNEARKLGTVNDSGQIKLTRETEPRNETDSESDNEVISVSELANLWRNSI